MDAAQRSALIDALESAFREVGVELYAGAERLKRLMDERYRFVEAALSRESLDAFFTGCTVEDADIADKMTQLFLAAPAIMQQFAKDAVVKSAAAMPKVTGRPRVMDAERQRLIIQKVSTLNRSGVKLGIAQERAAQELAISKRTVQTAWRLRGQVAEQPFQTMQDLIDFLEIA